MGASARRTLFIGVVLFLGAVRSLPLSHVQPRYDARLSTLELAIIKCIVETVPGVTKGGGGSYDWSVIESRSKEIEGAEIEVVQLVQREPDFTGRSGGGGYPDDWNIVRSVSSQLAARENDQESFTAEGGEGFSDDWAIVKSISTELHLDVEQGPGEAGYEPAYQPPMGLDGRGGFGVNEEVVFPANQPISPGGGVVGANGDVPIDIRLSGIPSANVMMHFQPSFSQSEEHGETAQQVSEVQNSEGGAIGWNIVRSISSEQEPISEDTMTSSGSEQNGGTAQQVSGVQNSEGGAIGWNIVRSISSEQEPISEDTMTSSGSEKTVSTSGTHGDADSYSVVQPISIELQPADSEAGEIPASLTEIFPPPLDQEGDSWNSQPSESGEQPSEIQSPGAEQSSPIETQEPCETGHKLIKNVCRKVYTFQLKSHLK